MGFHRPGLDLNGCLEALVKAAAELTSMEAPEWEFIAARLLNFKFKTALSHELSDRGITSLFDKISYLTTQGLYGDYILESYSKAEIEEAETMLCPQRDLLFNYSGLDLLLKRYVIHTHDHYAFGNTSGNVYGNCTASGDERGEGSDALGQTVPDMLSRLEVTMATPTLSNARKPYHQLSSCFIDTVPDSLDGIYRSVDNFAKVSKFGGGMGLYFGKVRATGSSIRGFEGAAGGVIRWIRLVNDTAVAVDQLGMRQGAAAVYLDVWHKDLPEFLQLRTNNGDDRMKAHDIFPAVYLLRICSGKWRMRI